MCGDENASSIALRTQDPLRTLEWIDRRETLWVCEPAGNGKRLFPGPLGHNVIEARMPVTWLTLEQLGVVVRAHRADDSLRKAVANLCQTSRDSVRPAQTLQR